MGKSEQQWRGVRGRSTRTAQFSSPAHARRAAAGGLESTRERRGLEELEAACFPVHANSESPVSPHNGPHPMPCANPAARDECLKIASVTVIQSAAGLSEEARCV
jgi:hypothetical protein